MKKAVLISLFFFLCVASCTRHRPYSGPVTGPPGERRLVTLQQDVQDPKLKPYRVNGETYYPLPDAYGFSQNGKASWYGKKFQGRPTSSGEPYNMYQDTAAHKTLPLGTYVRVTNLKTGKTVVVRINDRGPFVKGRIIDLSYASAKKIQMIGPGVVDVKIVALGKQVASRQSPAGSRPVLEYSDLNKGPFTVQVGAFSEKQNAVRLASRLKILFDYVTVTAATDENRRRLHRVHVSKSDTLGRAGRMEKQLEDMGFTGAFIVRL